LNIRYIPYRQIDKQKWDQCIISSPNGLIYARSFYLDAMASEKWDGLVMGDYEAVMPLTWNRKFGLYYLYQPYFMPALGVFGENITDAMVSAFLDAIPQKFRYWDIDLNETNHPGSGSKSKLTAVTSRTNHFLPLNKPYEDLRKDYKRLAKRMSQKAADNHLEVIRQASPKEVIGHYQAEYQLVHTIGKNQYKRLAACANTAMKSGNASTYLVKGPDKEISAFYLVFSDERFVYSVLGGSTSAGKESGAFYLLTDTILQDHAGKERIFRFEGSDIPGIAFFNTQFGSSLVYYNHLVMNNLPGPIKWLKR